MCWEGANAKLTLGADIWTVHVRDEEESFLSNGDQRVGHVGPGGPDKVACVGWGPITEDREGSHHRELENGLHC